MASSYIDLVKRLRQYDVPYSLRETAAKSIEDLLAFLAEETCDCEMRHHIDPSKHFPDRNTTTNAKPCRYRQLVEPEKPRRTVLDELEENLRRGLTFPISTHEKLLRLARVSAEGFNVKKRFLSTGENFDQHVKERQALRDIDPRLIDDE